MADNNTFGIVGVIYSIKEALEKEFETISIFRFQVDKDTPTNNLSIEVYMYEVVFPFYIDEKDFEDVPLLIGFMVEHIKREKRSLSGRIAE